MIYLMRHGADSSERYGGWNAYGLTEKYAVTYGIAFATNVVHF